MEQVKNPAEAHALGGVHLEFAKSTSVDILTMLRTWHGVSLKQELLVRSLVSLEVAVAISPGQAAHIDAELPKRIDDGA